MALQDGLSALIKNGSEIDLAALMTETLSGTELGTALAGVMEAGYLDGIGHRAHAGVRCRADLRRWTRR